MRSPTGAFTVAARMLGDMALRDILAMPTPDQLGAVSAHSLLAPST
jgi:hypothetical protein